MPHKGLCPNKVWPYTEHNACILEAGHKGSHVDDKGRPFDHARYIKQDVKNMDIDWPLENGVQMTVTRKAGDIWVIQDLKSDRELILSWDHKQGRDYDRLLFNGQDIETESYMGFIGLMDDFTEQLGGNESNIGTVTMDNRW